MSHFTVGTLNNGRIIMTIKELTVVNVAAKGCCVCSNLDFKHINVSVSNQMLKMTCLDKQGCAEFIR